MYGETTVVSVLSALSVIERYVQIQSGPALSGPLSSPKTSFFPYLLYLSRAS
jgi:hypothetical protein